jgi:uncharacterized protein YprB with RNaseH-like and TPR domain
VIPEHNACRKYSEYAIEPLPDSADVCFIDIKTAGLDPHREKIITIQARHGGETKVWEEWELGEVGCPMSLFGLMSRSGARSKSFVGYNILEFDVPFTDVRLRAEASACSSGQGQVEG